MRYTNTYRRDDYGYESNYGKDEYMKILEIPVDSVYWQKASSYINWSGNSMYCPAYAMLLNYYIERNHVSIITIEKELEAMNDPELRAAHRTFYTIKKGESLPRSLRMAKTMLKIIKDKSHMDVIELEEREWEDIYEISREYCQSITTEKNKTRITLCLDFTGEEGKIRNSKNIPDGLLQEFYECDESVVKMIDKRIMENYQCKKRTDGNGEIADRNRFFKELALMYLGFIDNISKDKKDFD